MSDNEIYEKLRERKIERMRLGQKACEIVPLASDEETSFAIVPLTEAEYDICMRTTAALEVPENVAGAGIMDRHEKREVIFRSLRNVGNLDKRPFSEIEQMMEIFEPEDVNKLYDRYVEMSTQYSPHFYELSQEEIDYLKELFANYQWSGLSGKQLYALNRCISALLPGQPSDNLLGSSLITS